MALDTLRAALWPPSDVALVCTGQQLHGRRDCPVCAELHYRRNHRRGYPGLAATCCNLVCTVDGVPTDCRIISALWKCADEKGFTDLWKWLMFPTTFNTPSLRIYVSFRFTVSKTTTKNPGASGNILVDFFNFYGRLYILSANIL